jgi:hypothetical protein
MGKDRFWWGKVTDLNLKKGSLEFVLTGYEGA